MRVALMWVFVRVCVLGVCAILLYSCSEDKPFTHTYTLRSADASYMMMLSDNALHLRDKSEDTVVMLVFVSMDCNECQWYYQHLQHLKETYEHLVILGVLLHAQSLDDVAHVAHTERITFPIVLDDRQFFSAILAQKRAHLHHEASKQESPNIESSHLHSSLEHIEMPSKQDLMPDAMLESSEKHTRLPYVVLYDRNGLWFCDYEGIIPEEIFASDIARLMQ